MKTFNQLMKPGRTMTLAVIAFCFTGAIYAGSNSSEDSAEAKVIRMIQNEIKKDITVSDKKIKGEVTFYFTINKDHQIVITGISGENEKLNYAIFKQFDFLITEEDDDLILTGINGQKIDHKILSGLNSSDEEFPVKISFQEGT